MGKRLPEKYKRMVMIQNGGYIRLNTFPINLKGSVGEEFIEIDYLFGIGSNEGILDSDYLITEWGLPENIILLTGVGHSWIALDYRQSMNAPSVLYIDTDLGIEKEIALNFSEFIDKLCENQSDIDDIDDIDGRSSITIEEAERIILSNQSEEKIDYALNQVQMNDFDPNWMLDQLIYLSDKDNESILECVMETFISVKEVYGDDLKEHKIILLTDKLKLNPATDTALLEAVIDVMN
nr:SMI1/KNR4 family protein [Lentibacillus saliphilus]